MVVKKMRSNSIISNERKKYLKNLTFKQFKEDALAFVMLSLMKVFFSIVEIFPIILGILVFTLVWKCGVTRAHP